MRDLRTLTEKVFDGGQIEREEALILYEKPLDELTRAANEIRRHFCRDRFDICTIINAKSGRCSENCRFCAQSVHHRTSVDEYPLLSEEKIVAQAARDAAQGSLRFSIVTSGRNLSDNEVDSICSTVRRIRETIGISVCVSVGLLTVDQFRRLKEAGVSRSHNNLETSRRNFPNICTTHTFDDKIRAIRYAQSVGLTTCSGGIMGLGESVEDRIDMAFSLRELGVRSICVNMLNAIAGTPFAAIRTLTSDDMRRIVAVYRFILPSSDIRLAGGRGLLPDKGRHCFTSGANAVISGDMLTTSGISIKTDIALLKELGYKAELYDE